MKVAKKIINGIRTYRIDGSYTEAHKKHREDHRNEYTLVDEVVSKFRATGGLKFEHQAYKLWALQKLLDKHRPRSILEFGSGSSSLMFSDYVRKNESTFLSIDEDPKWAKNTSDLIDVKSGESIKIKHADKVVYPNRDPIEIKYEIKITGNYDFVLIDGPSLNIESTKLKNAINSNFTNLEALPQVILVDVRRATAEYIANNYSHIYDYTLSDIFRQLPVESGYQYFSIFTKK